MYNIIAKNIEAHFQTCLMCSSVVVVVIVVVYNKNNHLYHDLTL